MGVFAEYIGDNPIEEAGREHVQRRNLGKTKYGVNAVEENEGKLEAVVD